MEEDTVGAFLKPIPGDPVRIVLTSLEITLALRLSPCPNRSSKLSDSSDASSEGLERLIPVETHLLTTFLPQLLSQLLLRSLPDLDPHIPQIRP